MSSTTISQSTTHTHTQEPIPSSRKKRSSNHPSNTRNVKANSGRWKPRPARPQIQLSADEKKQAYELLKKFGGRKQFRLPIDLPPWSPPATLEDIGQDLKVIRDYGSSPTGWDRPPIAEERTKQAVDSNAHRIEETTKLSRSTHDPTPKESSSVSVPPTMTAVPTTVTAGSSSASSGSSIPYTYPRASKERNPHSDGSHDGPDSHRIKNHTTRDRPGGSLKGKEKIEHEIDWTGWEPQVYANDQIEIIRKRYEYRAKELKRSSDAQRNQLTMARESSTDASTTLTQDELEELSNLAAVGSVESLLLFTQSFLCFDVSRSMNGATLNRSEHYHQWNSMTGFLSVAKSTARRSGIDLTYAICLMYESLLLDKLVEADRPWLLQVYAHETDTERQLEGFKKIKRMLNYQEVSKSLWLSAEKMFEKILSSSSSPRSTTATTTNGIDKHNKFKNGNLPRLKSLVKQMKIRERSHSPRLLSLDRPYKFCWPIDKTNPDSMSDFVVFSRAALDEFLDCNQDKIPFRLTRFDDYKIIFPNSGHRKKNHHHDHHSNHYSSSTDT